MVDKCEICGETTHSTYDEAGHYIGHMTKAQMYKYLAKDLNLRDRSFYSGEELAEMCASFLGKMFVFVADKSGKKLGIFKSAPVSMIYEAHPKPAKFIDDEGEILWRTDNFENLPSDAKEYRIGKSMIDITGNCPCGAEFKLGKSKKRLSCKKCGRNFEITNPSGESPYAIMLWNSKGTKTILPEGFEIKLRNE